MNPNARHVIDTPPRTKLRAFAEECPEVPEVLRDAAVALIDAGVHFAVVDRITDILKGMAGLEPPR